MGSNPFDKTHTSIIFSERFTQTLFVNGWHDQYDNWVSNHFKSGSFFSQVGIYKDKESKKGGWPIKNLNIQVYDDELYEKLFKAANSMIGIK